MRKERMPVSKFARKLIPFESSDIPAIQSWLEDMALKGLFYKDCGFFCARFEKAEPKKMRYRLDFCNVVAGQIPEEKKEMYELNSWQVVGEFKNDLVVLSSDNPEAPEIYSDHSHLVKPLKSLAKKHTAYWILFLVMFLFSQVGVPINSALNDSASVVSALISYGTGYYILVCLMAVLLLFEFILHFRSCQHLKKLIRGIEKGGELPSGEKYKGKSIVGSILIPLSIPIIILWALHLVIPTGVEHYKGLDDLSTIPFPTLAEINADDLETLKSMMEDNQSAPYGYYYTDTDLLAPTIIKLHQSTDFYDEKGGIYQDNRFGYLVYYYETVKPQYAESLLNEDLKTYVEFDAEEFEKSVEEIRQYLIKRFDEHEFSDTSVPSYTIEDVSRDEVVIYLVTATYTDDDSTEILLMQYENKYMLVSYSRSGYLENNLNLYIDAIKC